MFNSFVLISIYMYQIYKLQFIGLLLDMRSKIQGGLNFLKKLEIENLTFPGPVVV